jgi:hypothetical protein
VLLTTHNSAAGVTRKIAPSTTAKFKRRHARTRQPIEPSQPAHRPIVDILSIPSRLLQQQILMIASKHTGTCFRNQEFPETSGMPLKNTLKTQ